MLIWVWDLTWSKHVLFSYGVTVSALFLFLDEGYTESKFISNLLP